ncbi:OmpA family protein [Sphingosinicella sp. BN140058]|uniref:OmpA family protein n=1 Tax=Sphingosinicella sp. BN140058 TaxID=1892855 RepID=UPI0013EBAFCC|nr:OmpA family protein [Sphingosinicella sp. BN140058]
MIEVEAMSMLASLVLWALAAPPPPPALCDPFTVFFDTESASLSVPARALLENVRTAAAVTGAEPLKIVGHADRAGSETYNMRLSARRAEAVKAWLQARGISRSRMIVDAAGEAWPIVETEDGIAHPRNRYVSISLGC